MEVAAAEVAQSGESDELRLTLRNGTAVVRRVPIGADGKPRPDEARRLLATLYARPGSTFAQLVALLARAEDLSHILAWSGAGGAGADGSAEMSAGAAGGGKGDSVGLELLELPRLHLSFDVRRGGDGQVQLHSREHPGFFLGWMKSERHRALLRGLPHALLLLNEAGEAHVLLSAMCKPCRLTDPADPLQTQLLLARHSRGWADGLTGVRHYLYAMHRSGAYLTPPSLAARIYLLLLRWLARDFEGVYQMCACCASDSPLTAEEAQLWALLADFDDDMEPEAHACRLKLWLATRTCPELACPWQPAEQLQRYAAKLRFIRPSVQLPAAEELLLLRMHGTDAPPTASRASFFGVSVSLQRDRDETPPASAGYAAQVATRAAFLQAALTAEEAVAGQQQQLRKVGGGPDVNPWGAGGELVGAGAAVPAAPPLRCGYPARPLVKDFDAPLELREVLEPGSVSYP